MKSHPLKCCDFQKQLKIPTKMDKGQYEEIRKKKAVIS
jgi:hypothetical protein